MVVIGEAERTTLPVHHKEDGGSVLRDNTANMLVRCGCEDLCRAHRYPISSVKAILLRMKLPDARATSLLRSALQALMPTVQPTCRWNRSHTMEHRRTKQEMSRQRTLMVVTFRP